MRSVGDDRLQLVLEGRTGRVLRRVEVRLLAGIGTEVIELGTRRSDPLPSVVSHAEERGHSEALLGEACLGVLRDVRRRHAPLKGRQQVEALRRLAAGKPEDGEDRRHDVDVPHGPVVRGARGEGGRQTPDQRHVDRRIVDEDPVRRLPVLPEALAVVGGEDDERVVEQPVLPQPVDDPPHAAIGLGDLRVVRCRGQGGELERPDLVGLMRVEEVHPQEERLRLLPLRPFLEPRDRAIRGPRRRAIPEHEERRLVLRPEIVVIDLEALVQAIAPGEHRCRHERRRPVTCRRQPLGEGDRLGTEGVVPVVPNAVRRRVESRHDRAVGRERDRRGGRGIRAADALARQPVDRRGVGELEAVAADPVGT